MGSVVNYYQLNFYYFNYTLLQTKLENHTTCGTTFAKFSYFCFRKSLSLSFSIFFVRAMQSKKKEVNSISLMNARKTLHCDLPFDFLLQLKNAIKQSFRSWRTTWHININWNNAIAASNNRI